MQTFAAVEADDIASNIDPGLRMISILALPHPFHFEIQEESFNTQALFQQFPLRRVLQMKPWLTNNAWY